MQHPFEVIAPEYIDLMSRCVVTKTEQAASAAVRLLRDFGAYKAVTDATAVPVVWLMATNERESSGSLHAYFGNGEPLTRVTRLVPKGRGPFSEPGAWSKGCIDALGVDHVADVAKWDWARACYEWELWNGFGPRNHGRHTGYLWAGTSVYDGGKYISDGVWSPSAQDSQLGTVAVARAIITLRPELALDGWPTAQPIGTMPVAQKPPVGVGGQGMQHVLWAQQTLNKLGYGPIEEDGYVGRETARAVRAFQAANPPLDADGLLGPKTDAALLAKSAA